MTVDLIRRPVALPEARQDGTIPAPLPVRSHSVQEWAAAAATIYAGTRGITTEPGDWEGHTDASALLELPEVQVLGVRLVIRLAYTPGAADVGSDWGRLDAAVECATGAVHESQVFNQRDIDHLIADAYRCDGHTEPADETTPETDPEETVLIPVVPIVNAMREVSTGDLAMDRLLKSLTPKGAHRRG